MDCDYSSMEMANFSHMSTVPEGEDEKVEESSELRASSSNNNNNNNPLVEQTLNYNTLNEEEAAFSSSSLQPPMSGGRLGERGPQAARRKSSISPESIRVLDEMMESMALSFLIFLIADMRLMSATGRVMTNYENIAVESDYVVRDTAAILSGTLESLPSFQDSAYRDHGLSPAQMFTTVLIELKKTMDRQPTKDDCFKAKAFGKLRSTSSPKKGAGGTCQDSMLSTPIDGKGGQHKLNEGMHSLLKAYGHMVGNDLADTVPHVERRRSMINLMQSQTALMSNINNHASGTGAAAFINNHASGTGAAASTPLANAANLKKFAMRFSKVDHKEVTQHVKQACRTSVMQASHMAQTTLDNLPIAEQTRTVREFKETTDTLFQMGLANTRHGESLRLTLSPSVGASMAAADPTYLTPEELLKVMENAVKSRVRCNLDFMSQFFRDGTLSQLMIQSQISIVWVNDWYPVKDLVYAIGIDEEKRRVLVVFRGAITKQDWNKAFSSQFSHAPNPIQEDFEDKSPEIDMHRGFYEYLFRVRKDTHTTKFDEIAGIAHRYGMDRLGPDYKLAVVGHSLGAALSTVFGFWAAADARFTKNGPVKIFNFGSPMVGGQLFADSFRHLEKHGKLRMVRFFNHNDLVAHAPFNVKFNKRGSNFRHVGVGVQIPPLPIRCCKGKPWDPYVYYIGRETFWASYCRGIRQNMLLHLPWLWQMARMHTLAELLQRVMEGSETLEMNGTEFSLLKLPIEALYKELM